MYNCLFVSRFWKLVARKYLVMICGSHPPGSGVLKNLKTMHMYFFFQVVFVPLWIILTLLSVCVLYYIIWALLFMRSPEITNTQRHAHLVNSFMSCFIIVPLLTFMVFENSFLFFKITIPFSTMISSYGILQCL